MKTLCLLAIAIAAVSCKPLDGANPLDTPETIYKRPPAIGYFGPHSEYYPR